MAYDLTQNEEWATRTKQKQELEKSRLMSDKDRSDAIKKALGGS